MNILLVFQYQRHFHSPVIPHVYKDLHMRDKDCILLKKLNCVCYVLFVVFYPNDPLLQFFRSVMSETSPKDIVHQVKKHNYQSRAK